MIGPIKIQLDPHTELSFDQVTSIPSIPVLMKATSNNFFINDINTNFFLTKD
jgi:hypothetical protein